MNLQWKHDSAESVCSPYVEELRTLFDRYHLPAGQGENLPTIARELGAGGPLAEATAPVVRSIVHREGETLNEEDLLGLFYEAAGAEQAHISGATQPGEQDAALRRFFGSALRSFWRETPTGPYRSRLTGRRPAPSVPEPLAVAPLAVASAEQIPSPEAVGLSAERSSAEHAFRAPSWVVDPVVEASYVDRNQSAVDAEVARRLAQDRQQPPHPRPRGFIEEVEVLDPAESTFEPIGAEAPFVTPPANGTLPSRPAPLSPPIVRTPLHMTRVEDVRSTELEETTVADPARSEDHAASSPQEGSEEEEGVFPEYGRFRFFSQEHRTLWIVGICGVLIGLLVGLLLRGRSGAQDADPAPISNHSQVLLPKPSPYGPHTSSARANSGYPNSLRTQSLPGSGRAAAYDVGAASLPIQVADQVTAQAPAARYHEDGTSEAGVGDGTRTAGPVAAYGYHGRDSGSNERNTAVYLTASGVMAANLLAAPAPAYPLDARDGGIQGKVVVQALVGRDGHVLDAHIISGDQRLREAALEAVERWRYRPFVTEGRATEIETVATLDFRLFQ